MCPVCQEPMLVLELEQVEIDRCDRCGGTWLDAGELTLIVGDDPRADRLIQAVRSGSGKRRTPRRCPRCFRKLREISVAPGSGIVLDRCPRGHGLWCDRGETARLLRRFSVGSDRTIRFLSKLYENEANSAVGGMEWAH